MSEDLRTTMSKAGAPAFDCWEAEQELETARRDLEWSTMFLLHHMGASDERDLIVGRMVTAWVKVEAAEGMVRRVGRTLLADAGDR